MSEKKRVNKNDVKNKSKNQNINKSKRKKRKLKKKVKNKILIMFSLVILLILLIYIMFSVFKQKYATVGIDFDSVQDVSVFNEIIDENRQNRPGNSRAIKYIVMHETGNFSKTATALNHSQYLLTNDDDENSWHYTVDENEIYHHLPDHEVGWHASDGLDIDGGNLNGIGIEICVNEGSDYTKTVDNAAKLVAKLLQIYDLDIQAVKTHKDFSGKDCPTKLLLEDNWEIFIESIEKYIE